MASIKVTPETLDSQGKDLIKYASDLTEILDNIHSKISEIIEGWGEWLRMHILICILQ